MTYTLKQKDSPRPQRVIDGQTLQHQFISRTSSVRRHM